MNSFQIPVMIGKAVQVSSEILSSKVCDPDPMCKMRKNLPLVAYWVTTYIVLVMVQNQESLTQIVKLCET